MRVAIVHYHLLPGGVTTVIRSHSRLLDKAEIRHVILTGSPSGNDLPAATIPALAYHPGSTTHLDLLESLRSVAAAHLDGPPDVWHFHNHSLGKNRLLPGVIRLLAGAGEKILLHVHDLAEDGRPQNYADISDKQILYPRCPRIHYAFINANDQRHFIDAGLPAGQATHLPGSPPPPSPPAPPPPGPPLILYPSRAIRRKNLGEILLLSLFAPQGSRFAITRSPDNPTARGVHDRWKHLAGRLGLPIDFEVVDRIPPPSRVSSSFEEWLASATHFITTSVFEGQGLIFGEAAARYKPLIGRTLPSNPFPEHPSLYYRIAIPAGWIDPVRLRHHLVAGLTDSHRLYQQPLSPSDLEKAEHARLHPSFHDFGNLPEAIQHDIIIDLLEHSNRSPLVDGIPAASWLEMALKCAPPASIAHAEPKSPVDIYRHLQSQPAAPPVHLPADRILRSYLRPDRFHFLLTPPPRIRAVIFDIYGTLLISRSGVIRPDPSFDDRLARILTKHGHTAPSSPTTALHHAIRRHHAGSVHEHPEVNLLSIWHEVLGAPLSTAALLEIEEARLPCQPMPGASETIRELSRRGLHLGCLSNAQANTLPTLDRLLGPISPLLHPDLVILSYQHRLAKPSRRLFDLAARRLAHLGISPDEILFVGNDPLQDIIPARCSGFRTALFTGHPDSLRPGDSQPDLILNSLSELPSLLHKL